MDYLDHMPLKEICDKYNLTYNSLRSQIRRKKWHHERVLMDEQLFNKSREVRTEEEKSLIMNIRKERYECCVKIYQGLADEIDRCLKYNPGNIDKLSELMKMFMNFSNEHEKMIQS